MQRLDSTAARNLRAWIWCGYDAEPSTSRSTVWRS